MKQSRRAIVGAMGTMIVCLLSVKSAGGQAVQEPKPLLAEEVHKNVQVLRGIPEAQFMETMGFFSASLGANCTYCHVAESRDHMQIDVTMTDPKALAKPWSLNFYFELRPKWDLGELSCSGDNPSFTTFER
jgi:hypothetical protein